MHTCVGVDVSKHHLDWALGEAGSVERLPNTWWRQSFPSSS